MINLPPDGQLSQYVNAGYVISGCNGGGRACLISIFIEFGGLVEGQGLNLPTAPPQP